MSAFFLGFIFTQPLSKKGVSGAFNKGRMQKGQDARKRKAGAGQFHQRQRLEPKPHGKDWLPRRLGMSWLARYGSPQEGTQSRPSGTGGTPY